MGASARGIMLAIVAVVAGEFGQGELGDKFRHHSRTDARRFYQANWHPEVGCAHPLRLGNAGDGGKVLCSASALTAPDCLVVSIGSHGDYSFEQDVHALAPHCHIHTYDGTLKEWGVKRAPSYVTLFVRNMTATTYREYADQRVAVLKMDCEGCEFDSLLPWVAHVCTDSILLEIHTCHVNQLSRGEEGAHKPFAWGSDALVIAQSASLLAELNRTHAIYSKEPNIEWSDGTCIELGWQRRDHCTF